MSLTCWMKDCALLGPFVQLYLSFALLFYYCYMFDATVSMEFFSVHFALPSRSANTLRACSRAGVNFICCEIALFL